MTTIHLILNAHIDPIWLWPWPAGVDATLATCRTACDLLDRHPDIVFTRGEAWCYRQIERLDSGLFQRIHRHVAAGRWEIVGGWWIQPDCNTPSGFALERQIALGKQYFLDRFGQFPRIGYNVDSFGHAATLPRYLRAAEQDGYVMMRPQEHELKLPARLFQWRGYAGDKPVTTFRIANAYTTRAISLDHVRAAVTELPPGLSHTMCFVGVGDHGGGPTEQQIEWCRQHRHAVDGCELVFSSPRRFFDAVKPHVRRLPLVTGELQMHAIGCYTVHRPVKVGVRRAEQRMHQTALVVSKPTHQHQEAWEKICFHHFHDTLGGTCLPSAYRHVETQLGWAEAVADETLQLVLREKLLALPDDPLQRTVLFNASDRAFDGYVEFEPWLEWNPGQPQVFDEKNRRVPTQSMPPEGLVNGLCRLLCRVRVAPLGVCVLKLRDGAKPSRARVAWRPLPKLRLELIHDPSDTWSHGIDRYAGEIQAVAKWARPVVLDNGPLLQARAQSGRIGESRLRAEWRQYAGANFVELRLRVHWLECHSVLKLTLPLPAAVSARVDGIMGGALPRANDGRELPLRDWTLLPAPGSNRLGVVCPAVFALDVTPRRLRLTLLRSPLMAHHDPHPAAAGRVTVADQGEHEFHFRFFRGADATVGRLEQQATMMQRPLITADLTRGMPPHSRE